jgi:hypothetical protein
MSDTPEQIIADTISQWLDDDTPTGGVAHDIINALDDMGYSFAKREPAEGVVTDEGVWINIPDLAANDHFLPFGREGRYNIDDIIEDAPR